MKLDEQIKEMLVRHGFVIIPKTSDYDSRKGLDDEIRSLVEAYNFETLKRLVITVNSVLEKKNADWRFNFNSCGNMILQTLEQYETQTEGDKK